MAVVLSDPLAELVGRGQNAKYVSECKEIYLGGKNISKIRGFDTLVNLEMLWLNNNRLKKINNLDTNFRIKVLYAQDNQICTLKGSLERFKFLQQLDLSNNQLRSLEKLLVQLSRFQYLTHLNLAGNSCCEEPDYRLHTTHAIPSLRVLDQHTVTPAERRRAAELIGGDLAMLTVAFMRRVPAYDAAWDDKRQERSELEVALAQEAVGVRDKLVVEAWEREQQEFAGSPGYMPALPRGRGLPPNAGTQRALAHYALQHSEERMAAPATSSAPAMPQLPKRKPCSSAAVSTPNDGNVLLLPHAGERGGTYQARDTLDLFCSRAAMTSLVASGTRLTVPLPGSATLKFEEAKYEQFVNTRAGGRGGWELSKTRVEL